MMGGTLAKNTEKEPLEEQAQGFDDGQEAAVIESQARGLKFGIWSQVGLKPRFGFFEVSASST